MWLARRKITNVRLDEANITLDDRADVLDPLNGAFLVGGN